VKQNLYISALSENSGKSLVLLGLFEFLSKRVGRLGLFRPVIHGGPARDNDIELIRQRYQLPFDYNCLFAFRHDELRHLVANGQLDIVLHQIIAKYKTLEKQCDFVVCEGLDASNIDPALVDNLDTHIAKQLAAPILLVANGYDQEPLELVEMLRTERETYIQSGCTIAASLINRIKKDDLSSVDQLLHDSWLSDEPVFLLPEVEELAQPTFNEVLAALDGRLIYGSAEQLKRQVSNYKVAAMQLPNFLNHVQEGSLIITPGDRGDIILGSIATTFSDSYPNISGLILTGGLEVPETVMKLLLGFRRLVVPILSVETDTYSTATRVNAVRAEIKPDNDRKIAISLGLFEDYVDSSKLQACLTVERSTRMSPLMFEYDLIERAKRNPQRIVLPEGTDERILKAAEILLHRRVTEIILLGNPQDVEEKISALGLNLERVRIIDPLQSEWYEGYADKYFELRQHKGITEEIARDLMLDINYFGTMMVYSGDADGMVSGAAHTTAQTIRPALEIIRTIPGIETVSSIFFMCLEDHIFVYGDCAINLNPSAKQLADIAVSSAATATQFGIEPIIAMLSYSTGDSGKGMDVEKVREATQIVRKQRTDLQIEGPIQYDAAVDASVAASKLPDSTVAGHATVFVFPDLNTGNTTYKAVQRSAKAVAIGPILQGLRKPVNDLSRGCSVNDVLNTICITAIQAQTV
jgi:phosphate acetyltransferase